MQPTSSYKEYRCRCGKLLFRGAIFIGTVEIKCKRCNTIRFIRELNHQLLGDALEGALLIGKDGYIVNASAGVTKLLGFTQGELLTMAAHHVNPALTELLWKRMMKTCKTMPSMMMDASCRTKEGNIRASCWEYKFFESGESGEYIVATIIPKNTEESSVDEVWFGKNNNEVLLEVDGTGICTHADAKIKALLGHSPEKLIGKSILEFCPELEQGIRGKDFATLTETQRSFEVPLHEFLHADGTRVPMESYFSSRVNGENKFNGYRVYNWLTKTS